MRPPPVPFYHGKTIIAREAARPGHDAILHFAMPTRDFFASPQGTFELLLHREGIVHVHTTARPRHASGTLHFFGDFSGTGYPPYVALEPMSGEDAFALAECLKRRLRLPLLPTICTADELDERLPSGTYVIATGEYLPRDLTGGDPRTFGRVALSGSLVHDAVQEGRLRKGRYRVLGFYYRRSPDLMPIPGYGGPWLHVLEMESAS
jgi:hypothetical protein